MSVEHQPKAPQGPEKGHQAELEAMAKDHLEQLAKPEAGSAEHADKEQRVEAARDIINKPDVPEQPAPVQEQETPPAPTFAAKIDHVLNYSQTMASLQRKLNPASRTFSKVIHVPAIEKTSEALEKTVMRPSVVAGATWSAFLTGLIFYITARVYGFQLTGSEMLVALLAGAVLGILLEGLARLIRR